MKTLLQIAKRDDGDIDIGMAQDVNSFGDLALAFHRLSIKNVNFRALLCATFELLCRADRRIYDHLVEDLNKQPSQAAIHVAPNPTKS